MTAYPRAVSRFGLAAWQGHDRAESEPPPHPAPAPVPAAWPHPPARRTIVRLWAPLTLLFLLLSPVPLLLAPLAWLAPARFRPANPYSTVLALGRVLLSLGGTVVHVDTPDCLVSIRIL